jgi:hypothetical protein
MPKVSAPRIFWISGWSVPAPWLAQEARACLPEYEHSAVAPEADAVASVRQSEADILGGFSFGAHLLLGLDDPRPRILLAPFVDLKSEAGLGGAVATTQIKHLLRWLKRDASAAIADFHQRIGVALPPQTDPPDAPKLAWGLEQMLACNPPPCSLPSGSIAVAGKNDPLLDTDTLKKHLSCLQVIDSGHQLQPLLAAAGCLLQSTES